jgi:alanine racemase
MTNPSKLEQVAEAIASGLGYEWDTLYSNKLQWTLDRGSRHDINVPFQPDFIDAARAAIAAMELPTEEMVRAGDFLYGISPSTIYSTMIRAALK